MRPSASRRNSAMVIRICPMAAPPGAWLLLSVILKPSLNRSCRPLRNLNIVAARVAHEEPRPLIVRPVIGDDRHARLPQGLLRLRQVVHHVAHVPLAAVVVFRRAPEDRKMQLVGPAL